MYMCGKHLHVHVHVIHVCVCVCVCVCHSLTSIITSLLLTQSYLLCVRYDEWVETERLAGKVIGSSGRHAGRASYSKVTTATSAELLECNNILDLYNVL